MGSAVEGSPAQADGGSGFDVVGTEEATVLFTSLA